MPTPFETLTELLEEAVIDRAEAAGVPAPSPDSYGFTAPANPEFGDLATNAAMLLAKPMKKNPAEIAEGLRAVFQGNPLVSAATVARPGFLNLRLSPDALSDILNAVRDQGENYGDTNTGLGHKMLLEFVSANPTGPMHIGHLRHAAVGDALARILRAAHFEVTTEFYINDAGNQIETLGSSFRTRLLQQLGEDVTLAENAYPGEYLVDFAKEYLEHHSPDRARGADLKELTLWVKERCLAMIKDHLLNLGVTFDNFVSEKSLYENHDVEKTLEALRECGGCYEQEGALWLRTTDHGDDKDRVLVKSDHTLTYLVPDLAYHHHKFRRPFDRFVNIFGADHDGYPPRLKAGIKFLGHDPSRLTVKLLRLVFLVRNGERQDMGKRSGNFIGAMDLVNEVGLDVTRFFLIQRSCDSEVNFDIDLAREQSDRNPVLKIQYAHARLCSLLRKAQEAGFTAAGRSGDIATTLDAPIERELILHVAQMPAIIERCARSLEPHHLPQYLLALADLWNRYWSMARTDDNFVILSATNTPRTEARLALAEAIRQVFRNGLFLLGISAPERMARSTPD